MKSSEIAPRRTSDAIPSTGIPASSTDFVIIARRTSPAEYRSPSGTMTPSSTSQSR